MFRRLQTHQGKVVTVCVEGNDVRVPAGDSVAAVMLAMDLLPTRTTAVSGAPRAPLCMMGVCFECLIEIDGVANQLACQVQVSEGMRIRRQHGAGDPAS
ncbi:MAG: (2Fe-2S)-binding protein [Halobacteria archaeon]|nr:(2Fe-2S)-binding protein [Halobacteria archaeon]